MEEFRFKKFKKFYSFCLLNYFSAKWAADFHIVPEELFKWIKRF